MNRLIFKKIRPAIGLIFKFSKCLPKTVLIYHSLIHSKLSYCSEAWGNAASVHWNKLYMLQKMILWIINKKRVHAHTFSRFQNSTILPIKKLYKYKLLLHSFKLFNSKSSHSNHLYNTRISKLHLNLPPSKSAAGHRSASYQLFALWNKLPDDLKIFTSESVFKRKLKRHLLVWRLWYFVFIIYDYSYNYVNRLCALIALNCYCAQVPHQHLFLLYYYIIFVLMMK